MMLSIRQAYLTMYCFLEKLWFIVEHQYEPSKLDNLLDFLSGTNPCLWKDGTSADPAYWVEWKEIIDKMNVQDKNNLTIEEAFQAMYMFVEFHYRSFFNDLDIVVKELQQIKERNTGKYLSWQDWLDCATKASEIK